MKIILENVSIRRENKDLLKSIYLTINSGDNLAILGEDEFSKTLLAETIKGKHFHSGEILFLDDHQLPFSPKIAYLDHQITLKNKSNISNFYLQQRFNSMDSEDTYTVREELMTKGTEGEVRFWLQKFDILHRADIPLLQLSNGEKRKIQLIIHLLQKPNLLILNRAFDGLDQESRRQLHQMISHLSAEGVMVIMVADLREIPICISSFVEMKNGEMIQGGQLKDYSISTPLSEGMHREIPSIRKIVEGEDLIRMKNVSIRYGENVLLQNINWEVKSGECWQIKGKNGSGKSTLLSLINGDNPQAYAQDIQLFGKKRGSGESIWDLKKKIGWVSSELAASFPRNTNVAQVIGSGFYDTIGLFRKLEEEQRSKVEAWLNYFSLQEKRSHAWYTLAIEEKIQVLMARALVKEPFFLVLDEPFQGIPITKIRELISFLKEVYIKTQMSIIMVSHYTDEIPDFIHYSLELDKEKK